jgi:thiol:disulfide interchange protein
MKTKSLHLAFGLSLALAAAAGANDEAPAWQGDVDAAFAAARAASKPVLVDLYADWCGWCKVMERRTFPDPAFRDFAAGLVLLRVDVEDGGAGSELAARYETFTLPTLLLLEPSGALVGSVEGFVEAPQLVQRLAA